MRIEWTSQLSKLLAQHEEACLGRDRGLDFVVICQAAAAFPVFFGDEDPQIAAQFFLLLGREQGVVGMFRTDGQPAVGNGVLSNRCRRRRWSQEKIIGEL